jgi:hypothetical protein
MLAAMKRWLLLLVVVLVFGFVWWSSRGSRKAPDERLADHTRRLCKIAAAGIEHPDDGVRAMFHYYGKQGPTMAKDWADLLVLIERIDDDRAHDERARLASRRLHAPAIACARTFQQFAKAVEDDEDASSRLQRGVDRLGRTIELILGGGGARALLPPLAGADALDAVLAR